MKSLEGNSEFKATGITLNYTQVDLAKNQVIATIAYKNEVKMTVTVDFNLDRIYKEGCIDEIIAVLPIRDEISYIEEIKGWAEIFIKNRIEDPQKYFEQFTSR